MASTKTTKPPGSPFFAPSTPKIIASTPGGTKRVLKQASIETTKATLIGTTANLINAIVGSGIVGIPYAIYCSGLVTGIILVITCAYLTMKSLRLLIFTAQHVKAPSYETLCEASFGRLGFYFITVNMFIMAYGAMVSYLMIVKDTIPLILGVTDDNMKRSILLVISLCIMVPLSAQRDMADLAKTSRISVLCGVIMVFLVAFTSPFFQEQHNSQWIYQHATIVEPSTVFIGLGVLSFAFVCQHSAFIIAGSLHQPTKDRWSVVTRNALAICVLLALVCGVTGYLGYGNQTQGNILNNLDPTNLFSNVARGLLGSTMLFVYPMESYVARHVLVVLLFQGPRAHEGDDASILDRSDRRWGMTVLLYVLALVPALLFDNLGSVLSVTGAIGGSCLSYIGPGLCYLGIYGSDFMERINDWLEPTMTVDQEEQLPLVSTTTSASSSNANCCTTFIKNCAYYLLGMPLWCNIATLGAAGLEHHKDKKLQQQHTSRSTMRKSSSYQHPNAATLQPPAVKRPLLKPPPKVVPLEISDDVHKPSVLDFCIAIAFMLFGVVAMVAGLGSIFVASK